MVHSFEYQKTSTGCTIHFKEDGKERKIILSKGMALGEFMKWVRVYGSEPQNLSDKELMYVIVQMKKKFKFKKNPNNSSVFRPIKKRVAV